MKVGHRQVVNMIRQGGNRLLIKVVTVSRNLDPEDTARKKGTAEGVNTWSGTDVLLTRFRRRFKSSANSKIPLQREEDESHDEAPSPAGGLKARSDGVTVCNETTAVSVAPQRLHLQREPPPRPCPCAPSP